MRGLPEWTHRHIAACVREMTEGMAQVMTELDGGAPRGLPDLPDTLQYCYYVAGTVGVMLTGLFVDGYDSVRPHRAELGPRAPAFGRALQLTNILKDIREDLDRGFCWLPRTYMDRHGLSPENLVAPENRGAAVALLDDLVAVARRECDVSFEYSLILPRSEPGLRLFCLWPLLFALRTLGVLAHNPAVFEAAPVKIDRETVTRIMLLTRESIDDDGALESLYAECARGLPGDRRA
jgi:farnesyl-diphosphate farnesyltransferase